MAGSSDDTPESLGDGVTGSDVGPSGPGPDRSAGDHATAGDAGSSVSDLDDLGVGLDDDQEIVDLADRYEIQETIGRGGMGEVLRAVDKRLDRPVAIKRLLGELGSSRKAAQRFMIEAKSIAALNHFNVVQIYDYGRAADGPFIVMELVEGGSLAEKLEAGALELDESIDLGCQLCDALGAAHQRGIIHRDIKPANVLMTPEGVPKLSDFGLARQETADGGQTQAGAVLGTLDFMPPEQKVDARQTDARSDLWSLGATLYQMVTGKSPRVIRLSELPGSLTDVLGKVLEDAPADRYQTAGEFREALQSAVKDSGADLGDLGEGQCPSCGVKNDSSRKFCRECSANLQVDCLSCGKSILAWDKVCGQCGGNVLAALEERRSELDATKQEIESLRQEFRHADALIAIEPLVESQHPRLQEYSDWATQLSAQLQQELSEKESEREKLLEAARASFRDHADQDAVQLLEQVPEPLRDDAVQKLLTEARGRTAEAERLRTEMSTAVRARQLQGLVPKVERYLELRPGDARATQLLEQLQARATRREDPQARKLRSEIKQARESGDLSQMAVLIEDYLHLQPDDEKMLALQQQVEERLERPEQPSPGFDQPGGQVASSQLMVGQLGMSTTVRQVRVVAILLLVEAGLELLAGLGCLAFGGAVWLIDNFPGPSGELEDDKLAIQIMGGVYLGIGVMLLALSALHMFAGYRNLIYRGRTLGIVALASCVLLLPTCYCSVTSLGLMIYGLIIYLQPDVGRAFALVKEGQSVEAMKRASSFGP